MAVSKISSSKDAKILDLEYRLQEAEDTIEAIRLGSVDALVMKDDHERQQIYTLKSADYAYRVLIESMSQGALTISEEGTILYSNRQFSKMTESPLEHIIGRKLSSFVHEDDLALLNSILQRPGSSVSSDERTVRLVGPAHKEVLMSARKLPISVGNAHLCMVVTDMTERKRAENAKDEFISLASHQLRTPATGVKQYVGMLLEGYAGGLTDKQKTFAQTAFDSNERQLAIIDGILKTAQIDFGSYRLNIIEQDMNELVNDALRAIRPVLTMRKQNVTYKTGESVCALVEPMEINLVISNLIENASKYSPEGGDIGVELYEEGGYTHLVISDNGVGIEHNDQMKIFEKFTRVDNVLSDTVSGSGLGLYWVKKIVELHDGEILLQSELNLGSTFTIKLPSC